jgi:hypothetical protein
MIVDRRTFVIKVGKQDEVVEQIKKAVAFSPFKPTYRVYTPHFSHFDEVVLEIEFKDLAEFDRYWTGWMQKVTPEWWAAWNSLIVNGGRAESYNLVP